MKAEILHNVDNPKQLEKLYREDASSFKKEFNQIYPGQQDNAGLAFWNERLNYEATKPSWGSKTELVIVIVFALLAGLIASIPNITGIDNEKYLFRNISFIVFPLLSAYFIWKQKLVFKAVPLCLPLYICRYFYGQYLGILFWECI
jgi:hypothetical protein